MGHVQQQHLQQQLQQQPLWSPEPTASLLPSLLLALSTVLWFLLPQLACNSLAAAMVALLGLPHGAVDHRLHENALGLSNGMCTKIPFYAVYVGIIAAMGALMYMQFEIGFGCFLMLSAHHWGQSHGCSGQLRLTFFGMAVIAELGLFSEHESRAFLQVVVPGHAESIMAGLWSYGFVGVSCYFALAMRDILSGGLDRRLSGAVLKETSLLAVVAALSALTSLAWSLPIYFCLGHTMESWQKDFVKAGDGTSTLRELYPEALVFSALFLLAMAAMTMWSQCSSPNGERDVYVCVLPMRPNRRRVCLYEH